LSLRRSSSRGETKGKEKQNCFRGKESGGREVVFEDWGRPGRGKNKPHYTLLNVAV